MKLLVAAAAAAVALVLIGCEVFQIGVTVDRTAQLEGDTLTLTGEVTCSESEPIDLFPRITQGGTTVVPGELSAVCEGRSQFTEVFELGPGHGLEPGVAQLELDASTNPGRRELEDRVIIERQIILLPPR